MQIDLIALSRALHPRMVPKLPIFLNNQYFRKLCNNYGFLPPSLYSRNTISGKRYIHTTSRSEYAKACADEKKNPLCIYHHKVYTLVVNDWRDRNNKRIWGDFFQIATEFDRESNSGSGANRGLHKGTRVHMSTLFSQLCTIEHIQ